MSLEAWASATSSCPVFESRHGNKEYVLARATDALNPIALGRRFIPDRKE